jgi:hypothetical protein
MADGDGVSVKVQGAKDALAHARAAFPQPKAVQIGAPRAAYPPLTPVKKAAPTVGDELKAKSDNVDQYLKAIPKMHNGGPVIGDGPRMLKDGEHVLTAAEAKKARKHALMAVGMKSLAKEPAGKKTMGEPTENDEMLKQPSNKKSTSDIRVRPEKNQSAKIKIA